MSPPATKKDFGF